MILLCFLGFVLFWIITGVLALFILALISRWFDFYSTDSDVDMAMFLGPVALTTSIATLFVFLTLKSITVSKSGWLRKLYRKVAGK